jgi:hypothetical protein
MPERVPQWPPDEEPPSALAAFDAFVEFALLPQCAADRDATDSKHNRLTRNRPLMKSSQERSLRARRRRVCGGCRPGASSIE